jgi:transcriptional regulator with XRE-family HTH domain
MAPKNKVESVEGHDLTTLGERIRHLLQLLFHGNQSEMARSLNISQAMISKLARGEREPGLRVLQAMKAHPRINVDWLMGGGGEPLRPEPLEAAPDAMSAGDWLAPVSARILPGSAEVHRAMLRGDLVPVANSFRRPGRYLYEVQADDPIVAVAGLRIARGDLLLMDADVSTWADGLSILVDRLVAVRFPTPGGFDFTLARVFRDPRSRSIEIDAIGVYVGDIRPERDDPPDSSGPNPVGGRRRGLMLMAPRPPADPDAGTEDATAGPNPKRESPHPRPGEPVEIAAVETPPGTAGPSSDVDHRVGFGVGDVVAYCALMIRPDLRGLALGATRG